MKETDPAKKAQLMIRFASLSERYMKENRQ